MPLALAAQDLAAFGQRAQRDARLQVEVGEIARDLLVVALDELALAGGDVDLLGVVPLGLAVVEADEHRARPLVREPDQLGLHARRAA